MKQKQVLNAVTFFAVGFFVRNFFCNKEKDKIINTPPEALPNRTVTINGPRVCN